MSVASRTFIVHVARMENESLVQFKLMLPEDLKGRVEKAAKLNRRSLSKEIVATLEDAYPPITGSPKIVELYDLLTRQIHDKDKMSDEEKERLFVLLLEVRRDRELAKHLTPE